MPLIKSAIKKMRKDVLKTKENLGQRSMLKTLLAKALKSASVESVTSAVSALDTAAKKNLIHKNTAGRKKATLMKLLRNAPVSESAPKAKTKAKPKTKKTTKKKK